MSTSLGLRASTKPLKIKRNSWDVTITTRTQTWLRRTTSCNSVSTTWRNGRQRPSLNLRFYSRNWEKQFLESSTRSSRRSTNYKCNSTTKSSLIELRRLISSVNKNAISVLVKKQTNTRRFSTSRRSNFNKNLLWCEDALSTGMTHSNGKTRSSTRSPKCYREPRYLLKLPSNSLMKMAMDPWRRQSSVKHSKPFRCLIFHPLRWTYSGIL